MDNYSASVVVWCYRGDTCCVMGIIPEIAAIRVIATAVLSGIAGAIVGGVAGYLVDVAVNQYQQCATAAV